jgi:hypothetical protein
MVERNVRYVADTKIPSPDQLVTILELKESETRIIQAVKNMLSQQGGTALKKWVKSYEVKRILGVSSGTLQTLRDNGTLPFTKLGGLIYYSTEDIDVVMEALKRGNLQIDRLGKK